MIDRRGMWGPSLLLPVLLLATCGRPTSDAALFRSDRYHLEASLLPGWAGAEGPERLARPFTGLVAFNSWGQPGFWAPEVRTGDSATYSPQSTLQQVPRGGAYVVLTHLSGGPPGPPEGYGPDYEPQDLGGVWQPGDCREAGGAALAEFSKWGRLLRLEVYCQADASDTTAAAVNDLLAAWRFDQTPAGDPGWATLLARSYLPPAVSPESFPLIAAWSADGEPLQSSSGAADATRITRAEVLGETVMITFLHRWGDPSSGWSGDDCPADRCHWWRFEVRPDGELVMLEEGGAALLLFSMEGGWQPYSDPALGFATEVPGDWQVTGLEQQIDALGRSWTAVEFVSPDYALAYPPLDQYHFQVAVTASAGGTLTETVELGLSPLDPGFRDQIQIHCCLDVGGEPAMELLGFPPTRWGSRQLLVLHGGHEYRLTFYPEMGLSANGETGVAARRVLDRFLHSFSFMPVTTTPPPAPTITPVPTPTGEPQGAQIQSLTFPGQG